MIVPPLAVAFAAMGIDPARGGEGLSIAEVVKMKESGCRDELLIKMVNAKGLAFYDRLVDGLLAAPDHLAGIADGGVAEHVRMAALELVRDRARHVAEVEVAALAGELGLEHHLQQEVAELEAQLARIAVVDGLDHLVGLLDDEGTERARRLLAVPGAAARRSQPVHHVDQACQLREGGGVGHGAWLASGPGGVNAKRTPRAGQSRLASRAAAP